MHIALAMLDDARDRGLGREKYRLWGCAGGRVVFV
jgi:hypothetical protein